MAAKNLKMFILISGQEIIAELVHPVDPEYADAFIIKQALVVQLVPRGADSYGIGLLPLSPTNAEGEQRVYNRAVASECVCIPNDLVNAYIQRTTNIEIASTSSLIQLN
jgi:hypothetical protein